MKKFTKKLAVMLVLAMIVGMFSGVMSASAASAWSFKTADAEIAVNGTINMAKNEYANFDLYKNGVEVNAADYSVVWASSDSAVVWVNTKTGQARADKGATMATETGTAVVSATITNLKTGAEAIRSFTVNVGKVSAVLSVEVVDVEADQTLEIGKEYALKSITTDAEGNVLNFKQTGLYRTYFCDGLTIEGGKFTAEKAGEYTIIVAGYASKAAAAAATDATDAVVTGEIKVVVANNAPEFVSVKLAAVNKLDVTMSTELTATEASAIKLARVINGKDVDVTALIKKVSLSSDGTVITVETYSDFVNENVYKLSLANVEEPIEYTIAIGKAVAVKFSKPTDVKAVINTGIDIAVKYVDANGIEVSAPTGTLEISAAASSYAYYDSANKKLYIYKAGETVDLTAKFTLTSEYNADWSNKTLTSDTITVVGVDASSITLVAGSAQYNVLTAKDFSKTNTEIFLNDTGYSLFYQVKKTDDSYDSTFVYQVLNSGIIFINSATGAITPLASGTANVMVSKADGSYVDVVSIVVKPAAETKGMNIALSGSNTATNATGLGGTVTYTAKYVDQYGKETDVTANTLTVTSVGTTIFPPAKVSTATAGKVIFTTEGVTKGNYNLKITNGTYTSYVQVIVSEPDTNGIVSFKVKATKTAIDTAIGADSVIGDYAVTYTVVGLDKNNAEYALVTEGTTLKYLGTNTTVTDVTITLKNSSGNVVATGADTLVYSAVKAGTGAYAVSGAAVTKAAAGNYIASASVTMGTNAARDAIVAGLTISNSSVAPVVTLAKGAFTISKAQVVSMAALKAYIATESNGVITLPDDESGYTLAISGITYKTAISNNSYISGQLLIEKVYVTKTFTAKSNVEYFEISFNRVVDITITD